MVVLLKLTLPLPSRWKMPLQSMNWSSPPPLVIVPKSRKKISPMAPPVSVPLRVLKLNRVSVSAEPSKVTLEAPFPNTENWTSEGWTRSSAVVRS